MEFHKSNNEPAPEGIMTIDDSVFLAQSVKLYIRGKSMYIFRLCLAGNRLGEFHSYPYLKIVLVVE